MLVPSQALAFSGGQDLFCCQRRTLAMMPPAMMTTPG
jgi:hypothetical protein